MKLFRSALVALGMAALVAGGLRLMGIDSPPPRTGGWRELSGPEFD